MDFERLHSKITPRLRRIARSYNGRVGVIDEDDLYQEMSLHLWNNFREGISVGINEAYVIRGCEFHLLNYLRKKREKMKVLSLEAPLNGDGGSLGELLPDENSSFEKDVDNGIMVEEIKKRGLTKREEDVLSLILEGLTVRGMGRKLGISHVMVVKFKQKIIEKSRKTARFEKDGYQNRQSFTLSN